MSVYERACVQDRLSKRVYRCIQAESGLWPFRLCRAWDWQSWRRGIVRIFRLQTASHSKITVHYGICDIQADAFTWTSAIGACEKARFVQSAGTAK